MFPTSSSSPAGLCLARAALYFARGGRALLRDALISQPRRGRRLRRRNTMSPLAQRCCRHPGPWTSPTASARGGTPRLGLNELWFPAWDVPSLQLRGEGTQNRGGEGYRVDTNHNKSHLMPPFIVHTCCHRLSGSAELRGGFLCAAAHLAGCGPFGDIPAVGEQGAKQHTEIPVVPRLGPDYAPGLAPTQANPAVSSPVALG